MIPPLDSLKIYIDDVENHRRSEPAKPAKVEKKRAASGVKASMPKSKIRGIAVLV